LLYLAGISLIITFLSMVAWRGAPEATPPVVSTGTHSAPAPSPSTGAGWFQTIKPYCNSLEVETQIRAMPPPDVPDGPGWAAACYALAGKISAARGIIAELPAGDRGRAAGIVFHVGHPVADAGDDESAGPMMELVLEFWPQNFMARYHAGISAYELGQHARAESHLERFMMEYRQDDGWRRNADVVLRRLAGE
jgi:hypothetical protein